MALVINRKKKIARHMLFENLFSPFPFHLRRQFVWRQPSRENIVDKNNICDRQLIKSLTKSSGKCKSYILAVNQFDLVKNKICVYVLTWLFPYSFLLKVVVYIKVVVARSTNRTVACYRRTTLELLAPSMTNVFMKYFIIII